ncbi:mitochondrial carrier, partial [Ascobolus immersus RN42]
DIYEAGGIAAFSVDLLIYPLDTLKTRLQAERNVKLNRGLFRGLYQGVGSVIVATLPASGAFFTTYEHSTRLLTTAAPSVPTPFIHAGSSALAESISCAIICPAEVIKQNAQVAPKAESSFLHIVRALPSPFALFKGYTALVSRNLPQVALQFPLFEFLRERSHLTTKPRGNRKDGEGPLALGEVFLRSGGSGAVAAATASLVTQPVDVVKTRVMLTATTSTSPISLAGVEVVGKIWKEEGWRSFWRGGALRMVWMGVGGGLYLGCYESAKVWLGEEKEVEGL